MPIPTPKTNENQEEFIARCSEFLQNEGKDEKQSLAICYNQFNGKMRMKSNIDNYRTYEQIKKDTFEEIQSVSEEELAQCMADLRGNAPGNTYTSPAFEKVCYNRILARKRQAENQ
jgi:hypothetical protein